VKILEKFIFSIKKREKKINNLQQIVSQNPTREMECDREIHSDWRRRRRRKKKSEENYLCQYLCSRITLTRCLLSRHSVANFYHSEGERQFYFIYLPSHNFPPPTDALLHGHKYGVCFFFERRKSGNNFGRPERHARKAENVSSFDDTHTHGNYSKHACINNVRANFSDNFRHESAFKGAKIILYHEKVNIILLN
jgi:hypothetical protein